MVVHGQGGGAITLGDQSSAKLDSCTFTRNTADSHGGAIAVQGKAKGTALGASVKLSFCTLNGNIAKVRKQATS